VLCVAIKKKRSIKKIPWTANEVKAVRSSLDKYFYVKQLPGKAEIEQCMAKHSVLSSRTWKTVKDFIRNSQRKN